MARGTTRREVRRFTDLSLSAGGVGWEDCGGRALSLSSRVPQVGSHTRNGPERGEPKSERAVANGLSILQTRAQPKRAFLGRLIRRHPRRESCRALVCPATRRHHVHRFSRRTPGGRGACRDRANCWLAQPVVVDRVARSDQRLRLDVVRSPKNGWLAKAGRLRTELHCLDSRARSRRQSLTRQVPLSVTDASHRCCSKRARGR